MADDKKKSPWWAKAAGFAVGGPVGMYVGHGLGGGGWNPFEYGAEDPDIMTKEIRDPAKEAVAGPLSKYLASEIGKGLPRYEGALYEPLGAEAESRYGEFLGMDPKQFFTEKVADPTMAAWRRDVAPVIEEGWAGGLRGSGRYRDVEESAGAVSRELGVIGGKMVPDIYGKQLAAAESRSQLKTAQYQLEYGDWMRSLPQMNPALQSALNFLRGPTGLDVATALDPGQEGWFGDLLAALIEAGGSAAGGGTTAAAAAA